MTNSSLALDGPENSLISQEFIGIFAAENLPSQEGGVVKLVLLYKVSKTKIPPYGFFDQGLRNHWDRPGPLETSEFLQFSVGNQALSTPKMVQKCVQNGLETPKSPSYACNALLDLAALQKPGNAFLGEEQSIFASEGAA